MRKKSASTSIDPELALRVEELAKADDRPVAYVLKLCIEAGLPTVEKKLIDAGTLPKKPRAGSTKLSTISYANSFDKVAV